MNISQLPNLITLSRIALVPVLIVLLDDRNYTLAFTVFVIAGVSDGLDGWIAKRFNCATQIGAILDPLADKLLLVSAYIMLTVLGQLPFWLMVVVAFRDLLIVGGYIAYTSMYGPVRMQPSVLSKVNTFAQAALIAVVLLQLTAPLLPPITTPVLIVVVAVTTVASGAHYLWTWIVKREVELAQGAAGPHE